MAARALSVNLSCDLRVPIRLPSTVGLRRDRLCKHHVIFLRVVGHVPVLDWSTPTQMCKVQEDKPFWGQTQVGNVVYSPFYFSHTHRFGSFCMSCLVERILYLFCGIVCAGGLSHAIGHVISNDLRPHTCTYMRRNTTWTNVFYQSVGDCKNPRWPQLYPNSCYSEIAGALLSPVVAKTVWFGIQYSLYLKSILWIDVSMDWWPSIDHPIVSPFQSSSDDCGIINWIMQNQWMIKLIIINWNYLEN